MPSSHRPRIVVVGSLNMDLVVKVAQLPEPGQTIRGAEFRQVPGGKGANQAVAASRLGSDCAMIGRVGGDAMGDQMIDTLRGEGIDVSGVSRTERESCGVALISVDDQGENTIAVVPGANARLAEADLRAHEQTVASADAVLVQLEVPYDTVSATLEIAAANKVLTVLDPAPAPQLPLPPAFWTASVMTPNRQEAELLAGRRIQTDADAVDAASHLRERSRGAVVITLGERGAVVCCEPGQCEWISAPSVECVDATAAGDTFAGALAFASCRGDSLLEAVRFACCAAALATTAVGAQSAIPDYRQVAELVRQTSEDN